MGVAFMLTPVSASTLLREARLEAELSVRHLAERAGLAASTVSRIESGRVSPGVETLERLLDACGQELTMAARPSSGAYLADFSQAMIESPDDARPDWTKLRSFLDYLFENPERRGPSVLQEPSGSNSALMDNLLAAIAETISDEMALPVPEWTKRIPPLEKEWAQPGTSRMIEEARAVTPERFARRNLTVSRNSLWRDRVSDGV